MINYKKQMKCLKANCKNKAIADSVYCLEHKVNKEEAKPNEQAFREYQEKSQKYDLIQETAKERRHHSTELRRLSRKLGDLIGGL